jgi:hypothetical protein
MNIRMKDGQNDTDRVKQIYWEKNLSQCYFFHNYHIIWSRFEPEPPQSKAFHYPPESW